ncbi:MAG: hypothetical protein KJ864_06680, partial [Candidatus Omnitrophica bacterium]|nr:hypothetical protein [Candidatus Omnitrophota bacterium]
MKYTSIFTVSKAGELVRTRLITDKGEQVVLHQTTDDRGLNRLRYQLILKDTTMPVNENKGKVIVLDSQGKIRAQYKAPVEIANDAAAFKAFILDVKAGKVPPKEIYFHDADENVYTVPARIKVNREEIDVIDYARSDPASLKFAIRRDVDVTVFKGVMVGVQLRQVEEYFGRILPMEEGLIKAEDLIKRFGEDDDGRIFIEDLKQEPGFYIAEYTEDELTGLRRLELRHKFQGTFETDENGKVTNYTGYCICDIGREGNLVYMCNTNLNPDVSLHGKTFVNRVLDPETGELEPSFLKVEGVTVGQNGNVIGAKDKIIIERYEHRYNPATRKYEIQSLKNEQMGYSKTFSNHDKYGNPGYEAQYDDSGFVSESDILRYHTCPYTGKPTNVPSIKETHKPGMHKTKDVFEKDSRIVKQEDLEDGSKKYFSEHDANKRPWHEKFYDEDNEFLGDAEIKGFHGTTNMPKEKLALPVGDHPQREIINPKGGIIEKVDLVTEYRTEFSGHDELNRPTVEKEYDDVGKITKREVRYIDSAQTISVNGKDVSVPEGGKVVVFNTYDLDEKYVLKQGIYAEDRDLNTIYADEWDEYGQRRILVYDKKAKVLLETSGRGDEFVTNRMYVDRRKYPFLKKKVKLLIHEDLRDGTKKDISYTLRADGKTLNAIETGLDTRGREYTRRSIVDGTGRYLESVCTINHTGRSSETLYSWEIEKG